MERPPATLNGADWRTSEAKQLVAQDIIDGEIPMEGHIDVDKIFHRLYEGHKFFNNFPFDETRYKSLIESLRKAIKRLKHWADYDSNKVLEDLAKHPPTAQNIRAELRWDGSDAQKLLKQDMDNGLISATTKPKEFRETRPEYQLIAVRVFQKHINQAKQNSKGYDEVTMSRRYKSMRYGDKTMRREAEQQQQQASTPNQSV
jgi:DNA-binding MarR family transcriptional regulator